MGFISVIGGLALQLVRCINCASGGHDWVDYAAALGGLVGATAAIAALVFAARSAGDAKRSADAAEKSAKAAETELELFREEVEAARAERARRAKLRFRMTGRSTVASETSAPKMIVLDLGVHNGGNRAAERVRVNVRVPVASAMLIGSTENKWGSGVGAGQVDETPEADVGRGPEPCRYWNGVLGPFDPGTWYVTLFLKIQDPRSGDLPIGLTADHEDLPGGSASHRFVVEVPATGGGELVIRQDDDETRLVRPATE